MKCISHPVSPAIGNCLGCDNPLCGVCAHFLDGELYCEACERKKNQEQFVNAQQAQLSRPAQPQTFTQEDPDKAERETQAENRRQLIQIGVIAVCGLVIAARLYFYFQTQAELEQQVLPGGPLPVTAFPECLITFQEIGQVLVAGRQPPFSLRCADSNVPNIVTTRNGVTRVAHPNPGVYGLSELYVTSDNPLPQVVD